MALLSTLLTVVLTTTVVGPNPALAQGSTTIDIAIPTDLATRRLVPDVYGYSIEPIWLDAYISTPKTANLLGIIAGVTGGKPPPIRVGGNTADQTYLLDALPTGNDSVAIPGLPDAKQFNITPRWYDTWAGYFPDGTDLIYTLNFAANESGWANAVAQAEAAHRALGSRLVMFELGNEIDHFINKGWRDADWGVASYTAQFRNLTAQITGSAWYRDATASRPKFQAGVFADPPWVPDQHDEIDDFSVANLTGAGFVEAVNADDGDDDDSSIIGSYAMHLYPQSTCDTERWLRMRLDLLSDHLVLWGNVSQYGPQVAAADAAGAPLVMGETNSVSCSGKSGISDTLGAALWTADYVLAGASLGIERIYFHLGAQSEYSAFTPQGGYALKNESLEQGIRANWYGHYFIAKVVAPVAAGDDEEEEGEGEGDLRIAALPGANSSTLSGYSIYSTTSSSSSSENNLEVVGGGEEEGKGGGGKLKKLVFLDMGVWNGTEGLSNPSTLSATDGTSFSEGARPVSTLRVATPWCAGARARVARLSGPGTNAKSLVQVSGVTFDAVSGDALGDEVPESVVVGEGGVLELTIPRAEAVLLEIDDTSACSVAVDQSGAARVLGAAAPGLLAAAVVGLGMSLLLLL
ncbi:glycoside hydrolase superfamily [Xylariomycetidae sp. FL2044]|nr:glycoside hydrolase superfamily [Xylariomycetidae sp. FL2044]